jgi:hypothetical protein
MMPVLVEPALVERLADGSDAAVHHVGRGDEVGAGRGVRERRLHELSTVASLRISSPSTMPQWPCDVYSQRQTSVITSTSGSSRLIARMADCTGASGSEASEPDFVLVIGQSEQQDAGDAVGPGRGRFR